MGSYLNLVVFSKRTKWREAVLQLNSSYRPTTFVISAIPILSFHLTECDQDTEDLTTKGNAE